MPSDVAQWIPGRNGTDFDFLDSDADFGMMVKGRFVEIPVFLRVFVETHVHSRSFKIPMRPICSMYGIYLPT